MTKLKPIRIRTRAELSQALRLVSGYLPNGKTTRRAIQKCIVATNGDTYLLDDMALLSDADANEMELKFPTKDGKHLSVLEIRSAIQTKDRELLASLVHNAPLVHMLEKIQPFDLYKTPLMTSVLSRSMPIVSPVITVNECSHDGFDMRNWFNFHKTRSTAASEPGTVEKTLKKNQVFPNKALKDLIWFSYQQAEQDYKKLQENQNELNQEAITHRKIVFNKLKQKRELLEDKLLSQRIGLEQKIESLDNLTKEQEQALQKSEHKDFISDLQGKDKATLKEKLAAIERERHQFSRRSRTIKNTLITVRAVLGFSAVFSILPGMILLGPVGCFVFLIPLTLAVSCKFLELYLDRRKRDKMKHFDERIELCRAQIKISHREKYENKLARVTSKLAEIKQNKKNKVVNFDFKANSVDAPSRQKSNVTFFQNANQHCGNSKKELAFATSESGKELILQRKVKL